MFREIGCNLNENYDGDVRVTALDYKAVVVDEPDSRGKAVIREILTFDVRAHSRDYLVYELWRALPEEYVDGVKVEYNVLSVRQLFHDGSYVTFKETPNLYWWDYDYINPEPGYGPGHWHHSEGPYDGYHNWECVLFYVDGLYKEVVYFEVVYEMYNASLRYNDASEFYVSLYSEETIKHLKSVKGQILFPMDIMPGEGNYNAFTYGTSANSFPFTESTTLNPGYHTFSFELDQSQLRFRPYNQYIEFALIAHGEDRHIFTQHADLNTYYNTDKLSEIMQAQADYEALSKTYRTAKLVVLLSLSATVALVLFAIYLYNDRTIKKGLFLKPATNIDLYREIPSELDPCFAATLVHIKNRKSGKISDGYSAVMLSLVQKGYIDLQKISKTDPEWTSNNVNIIVKYDPRKPQDEDSQDRALSASMQETLKPLSPTEELYYNLILRHARNGLLSLDRLQESVAEDYSHTCSFVMSVKAAIKSIGARLGYFQIRDYRIHLSNVRVFAVVPVVLGCLIMLVGNLISFQTRMDLAYGAFFILGAGLFAAAVYLIKVSGDYILFTQEGVDEYAKWRGLYKFLKSNTLMDERTVLELAIWEYYLVYATAFGISKKVIKALSIRCPNAAMSPVLGNPYFRTRYFYSSGRRFRYATRSASVTSHSGGSGGWSGGSGGWGGYGGSGRGGGGGGGGH